MRSKRWMLTLALAACGLAALLAGPALAMPPKPPPPPPQPPVTYRLTWVDVDPVGLGVDMNDSGVMVGYDWNSPDGRPRAFLYTTERGVIDLNTLIPAGDPNGDVYLESASGINNSGQVVGGGSRYENGKRKYVAFRFTPGKALELLQPNPNEFSFAEARGVNDNGEVVLNARLVADPNVSEVLVYDSNCNWIRTGVSGNPTRINNHTQVIGSGVKLPDGLYAFRWSPTEPVEYFGSLIGKQHPSYYNNFADDINDSGQFVGSGLVTFKNLGEYHAYRYTDGVGMQDLGTLGGNTSGAGGINELGHVVGYSVLKPTWRGYPYRGFLFTDAAGMWNLDDLVVNKDPDWLAATGIDPRRISTPRVADGSIDENGFGQICGVGVFANDSGPNGYRKVFLLTPVPAGN